MARRAASMPLKEWSPRLLGPGPAVGYEWRSGKAGELPKLSELLDALLKK